jgi:hypothetical protein
MARKKEDPEDKKKKVTTPRKTSAKKPVSKAKKKPVKKKTATKPKKPTTKKTTTKKASVKSKVGFGSNMSYNRVRHVLWERYKHEYPSYRDFISSQVDENGRKIKGSSIVSKVYAQCKSLECNDEDILAIYRQFKDQNEQDDPPILPDDYYEPRPYFELLTVDLWDGLDERLWVYSPDIIMQPSAFLGILGEDRAVDKENKIKDMSKYDPSKGDRIIRGKKDLFHAFVTYCNHFQQRGVYTTSDDVPHVKFVGKDEMPEPYWNAMENRWEIMVVPVTPFGDPENYGYDPEMDGDQVPDMEDLPDLSKRDEVIDDEDFEQEEDEDEEDSKETSRVEKVRIEEIRKTSKLERLEKKKEGILKEIETYSKIGKSGKPLMDDAVKRLMKINKEIDEID